MKKSNIVILVMLLIIYYAILYKILPSDKTVFFNDTNMSCIVVEDNIIFEDNPVIMESNNILISFDVIKKYIDPNIYFDENENMVVITLKDRVGRYKINSQTATINNKVIYLNNQLKSYNDVVYVPLDIVKANYDLNAEYNKDTNIVVIDFKNVEHIKGEVIDKNADIRTKPSIKAPILSKNIYIGSKITIYEEFDKWYKVRTESGIVGYINKSYVKIIYQNKTNAIAAEEKKKEEKINLTWDYVYSKESYKDENFDATGLNVISPTWFSIVSKEGLISDKGNFAYVQNYHSKGYKVWGLVNNSFDPDITHEILNNSTAREKIINELLDIYEKYQLDGINLDFENIYLKDKDAYVQFIRELVPLFREKGMKVSIDVTNISVSENWSMSFDRKRLGEAADYIILMSYDQYWSTSPVAGSVAQYIWVEDGLEEVLNEISSEKLILGVPFYTRLWKTENIDGVSSTTSSTLTMENVEKFIEEKGIELVWDESSGQYVAEYIDGNNTYKIWVEDSRSIQMKTSLVNKYELAGVASWRKGFEKNEIWEVINSNLN
jgi:spore germination protein YaaH